MTKETEAAGASQVQMAPLPDDMEDRVVASLRARGLLGRPRLGFRHRRSRPLAALAAGLALFLGGTASGLGVAGRTTSHAFAQYDAMSAVDRAASVQRAGTEYVSALASLSASPLAPDDPALRAAKEVGRVALHAAALELARLDPGNPAIAQILAVLEGSPPAGGLDPEIHSVVWY